MREGGAWVIEIGNSLSVNASELEAIIEIVMETYGLDGECPRGEDMP